MKKSKQQLLSLFSPSLFFIKNNVTCSAGATCPHRAAEKLKNSKAAGEFIRNIVHLSGLLIVFCLTSQYHVNVFKFKTPKLKNYSNSVDRWRQKILKLKRGAARQMNLFSLDFTAFSAQKGCWSRGATKGGQWGKWPLPTKKTGCFPSAPLTSLLHMYNYYYFLYKFKRISFNNVSSDDFLSNSCK